MDYWKVVWHHDHPDEPTVLYSEIDAEGYEVRKTERFRDGRYAWADDERSFGGALLCEVPVGDIEDVREQEEFDALVVTREEFEAEWRDARAWGERAGEAV